MTGRNFKTFFIEISNASMIDLKRWGQYHPGKIYVKPKTHKFDSLKDIEIEHQLKLLKMKHMSHGFLIYPAKETSDYIIHQIYIEK